MARATPSLGARWRAGGTKASAERARARGRVRARPPWPLALPAAVAVAFLLLPLVGLLARAPWSNLPELLEDAGVASALRLSLLCATAATGISLLIGVPLAWVLSRLHGRSAASLRALVTLPLVFPPVVGGVALLTALGRTGIVGRRLEAWFGVTLPFTTA